MHFEIIRKSTNELVHKTNTRDEAIDWMSLSCRNMVEARAVYRLECVQSGARSKAAPPALPSLNPHKRFTLRDVSTYCLDRQLDQISKQVAYIQEAHGHKDWAFAAIGDLQILFDAMLFELGQRPDWTHRHDEEHIRQESNFLRDFVPSESRGH